MYGKKSKNCLHISSVFFPYLFPEMSSACLELDMMYIICSSKKNTLCASPNDKALYGNYITKSMFMLILLLLLLLLLLLVVTGYAKIFYNKTNNILNIFQYAVVNPYIIFDVITFPTKIRLTRL